MSGPVPTVDLRCGVRMPLLGLGTYKLHGDQLRASVDAALAAGYRAFDTAAVYGNEGDLGQVLRDLLPEHGLLRSDVFVISKLSPEDHGPGARGGCLRSLQQLGLGYVDLYLLHWPGAKGLEPTDPQNPLLRAQSWAVLEEMLEQGSFRAIGVSNYTEQHLRELLGGGPRVPPAVLQTEFHPLLGQGGVRELCRGAGIHLQAYSSLGKGALLEQPEVQELARDRGRAPAQVLLRWAVQGGVSVLPRSAKPARVWENAGIFDFELSDREMDRLAALECGKRFCRRDPTNII